MGSFYQKGKCNGAVESGNHHNPRAVSKKGSLSWLDLRVFYLRISKCEIDYSTPEFLTLNHIPLNHNTLLELNGVRTSIYSDGLSTLLRRDRIDKKTEEVTFVNTDTIRATGSLKFEVLQNDVLLLSGDLEFCSNNSNGFAGESGILDSWSISWESDMVPMAGFLKGSPAMEVYVAGSFSGSPFILTKTIQLGQKRKQLRKGIMLEPIPEYEVAENKNDNSYGLQMQVSEHQEYKTENEDYMINHQVMEYLYGEDEELSWFNAGVRVGVGIGLSVCVGLGIGVGLLVKTYQGTTRNFLRRLL